MLCKDEQRVELRGNVPHEATANKFIIKIVDGVQPCFSEEKLWPTCSQQKPRSPPRCQRRKRLDHLACPTWPWLWEIFQLIKVSQCRIYASIFSFTGAPSSMRRRSAPPEKRKDNVINIFLVQCWRDQYHTPVEVPLIRGLILSYPREAEI